MSGRIVPLWQRGIGDGSFLATCDVCPWTADRPDLPAAEKAQREHEAGCRPSLPEEIPDLEFLAPPCPVCSGYTDHEDGAFYCERCELRWTRSGEHGRYIGDPPPPPEGVCGALPPRGPGYCSLPTGHDSRFHMVDAGYGWSDPLAPAVAVGERAPDPGAGT